MSSKLEIYQKNCQSWCIWYQHGKMWKISIHTSKSISQKLHWLVKIWPLFFWIFDMMTFSSTFVNFFCIFSQNFYCCMILDCSNNVDIMISQNALQKIIWHVGTKYILPQILCESYTNNSVIHNFWNLPSWQVYQLLSILDWHGELLQ